MEVILKKSFHLKNSANDSGIAEEYLLGPTDFQFTNSGFTQEILLTSVGTGNARVHKA